MNGPECNFTLIDHHGRPVNNETFAGKFVLVFFGFTHCKVVCPRALARITQAIALLNEISTQIQPLYITVDPARDTPDTMRAFLMNRFPQVLGLTGNMGTLEEVRRNFKAYAAVRPDPDRPGEYDVPHSAFTYLLGSTGKYLAHFPDSLMADELSDGIRRAIARVNP